MRVGSSPITRALRSSTAPTTALVFHSSDASPQPHRPAWSVSTFTNTQLRISALTTRVLIAVIFMASIHRIEAATSVRQQGCSGDIVGSAGAKEEEGIRHRFGRLKIAQRNRTLCAATVIGFSVPLPLAHAHSHNARG